MKAFKKAEKVGRQSWLAGVGLIDTGRTVAADKLDKLYVESNAFVADLLEKGESINTELKRKVEANVMIDDKIAALKAKLGMQSESRDIQLERLSNKVDDLIDVVAKLAQKKAAEKEAAAKAATAKPAAKKAPAKTASTEKAAAPASATKAPAKRTTTRKPAARKAPAKSTTTRARKPAQSTPKES